MSSPTPAAPRPLVGRTEELAEIRAGLDDALSGRGRMFLLAGEPGIGKTRLSEEVAAEARDRNACVAWGRCWDGGGAPAYWPWVQIIRACDRDDGGSDELASLRRSILARMEPDGDAPAADTGGSAEQARFRLFDATAQFLKRAARACPLMVVFDDLHAADAPSVLLLQFLARELADARVLLVAAYRDAELRRAGLTALVAALARDSRRLDLRGLGADEVGRFISAACRQAFSEGVVAQVHRITGGNPFFVDEVGRRLRAGGVKVRPSGDGDALAIPDEVRDAIRQRLAPLSETTRAVLSLAAVIGREFAVDVLAALTDPGSRSLLALLDDANEAGLIQPAGVSFERWAFTHDLIRDTLRADLPPSRRIDLHRRIGELLEGRVHSHAAPSVAEIAHHYFQAAPFGSAEKALLYAVQAGDLALQQTAFEEAASHYERALRALDLRGAGADPVADTVQRCQLLLSLGRAQRQSSQLTVWAATYQRAALCARELATARATPLAPALLAEAALGVARRSETGAIDAGIVALIEEALAAVGHGDDRLRARLQARLAMALYFSPQLEQSAALSAEALALGRRCGDPATVVQCLLARHFTLWQPGTVAARLAVANELVALSEQLGDAEAELEGRLWRLVDLVESGVVEAADGECRAIEEAAATSRLPMYRWRTLLLRAARALCEGRLDDADRFAQEALAAGQRAEAGNAMQFYAAMIFHLRRAQGRLGELAPAVLELAERYPALQIWRAGVALLHVELGRPAEARAELERLGVAGFADLRRDGNWLTTMAALADVCASLDDQARAAALYELLLPHAAEGVVIEAMVAYLGPVAYWLGRLATVLRRWDDAARHLEAALRTGERLGAHLVIDATRRAQAALRAAAGGEPEPSLERGSGAAVPRRSPATFRKDAQFWTIEYGGTVGRLKDSRGLFYLHYLLRHPGREFLANDLVTAATGAAPSAPAAGHEAAVDTAAPRRGATQRVDVDAVLDDAAKAAYRARLRELKDELEEAEEFNDLGRVERARQEIDAITQALSAAIGLGGRDRQVGGPVERARIAVTKAILLAMKTIAANNPPLRWHLNKSIRTGRFCSYQPDPSDAPDWTTE